MSPIQTLLSLLREGRFERSLAFVVAASALISALEVTLEHYRGSFGQRVMYSPIILCVLLCIVASGAVIFPGIARTILPWASGLLILDGIVGFGFHVRGIARKPGGWTRNLVTNIVMGPPLFAPLLLGISGILGLIAARLLPEQSAASLSPQSLENIRCWLASATFVSAGLNGVEALYSHYKSNFSSRAQWIPIVLTPPLMIASGLAIWFPSSLRIWLGVFSVLALIAGMIGAGFHLHGSSQRPGGLKRIYNLIYGPPLFAPLLFSATGFLGLLAIQVGSLS